jgi:Zn-dependent protease
MVFIPFMGAVIEMRGLPRNAYDEAIVAAGGPLFGTAAAVATAGAAVLTDSQLLFALAVCNLLLSLSPLSRARVSQVVSFRCIYFSLPFKFKVSFCVLFLIFGQHWGYMINAFNLLPIGSMDGGRIAGAVSPWIGVGGLGCGGLLIYSGAVSNPIFYLIMMGGAYSSTMRILKWDEEEQAKEDAGYYDIGSRKTGTIAAG